MMEITKDFIPSGRGNRPGFFMYPQFCTIHNTGNPNATAIAHASYLSRNSVAERLPVSWHFTVDDQNIVQHLPTNEAGFHAGDGINGPGNRSSIGIEICEFEDEERQKQAEANAAELIAYLLKEHDLTVDKVVQHNRWSGKNCPRVLRARHGGWEAFMGEVKKYLDGEDKMFKDINDAWYPSIIEKAAEAGLISGYSDGTVRPKELMTFERFVYILMRYRQRDIHQGTITDLVNRWKRSVVLVTNDRAAGGRATGSGSFISNDGLILTNKHVTDGHSKLTVTWVGGLQLPAEFVRDSGYKVVNGYPTDLALIKVSGITSVPVVLSDSYPKHGEFCVVMGAPLAKKDSATFGIVSYPNRGEYDKGHYVQVDAAINPGNSGGACFDMQGRMIGVPTNKYTGETIDNMAHLTSTPIIKGFLQG